MGIAKEIWLLELFKEEKGEKVTPIAALIIRIVKKITVNCDKHKEK